MTTDLKTQILEVLVFIRDEIGLNDCVPHNLMEKGYTKMEAAITLLQDPNVFVGKWEPVDIEAIKREATIWYDKTFGKGVTMPSDRQVMWEYIDHLHQRGLLTPPPPKDTK